MTDPDALRAFADSMLAPLDAYDREHDGELLGSLQAFLQHNARWETAAAELFVHRHTLRYRMRKVEELTGRDLSSSFDRMEFWLALRARDLQAAQTTEGVSPALSSSDNADWAARTIRAGGTFAPRTRHTGGLTHAVRGSRRSSTTRRGTWLTATRCSSTASG